MVVGLSTTKLAAGVVPNLTDVAPVSFAPVMVTLVPPEVDPLAGVSESMAGRLGVSPVVALDQLILTYGLCSFVEMCVVWPRA